MAFRGLIDHLLNLVFPPRCFGCGKLDTWLCPTCRQQIPWVSPPYCPRCGRAMAASPGAICSFCSSYPLCLDSVRAAVEFDGLIRQAVHAFKYQGQRVLAQPLGGLMAQAWDSRPVPFDCVMPVPLHPRRLQERGYNQSLLLANELSKEVDLAVLSKVLVRSRMTRTQTELSAGERRENVAGAFALTAGSDVSGQSILLIDDVCTTGATLDACASTLKAAGAAAVFAYTLSRARWNPQTGAFGDQALNPR